MVKFKISLAVAGLVLAAGMAPVASAPALAQTAGTARTINLSIGRGQQINLPRPITDVFVANPAVADVDVRSARLLYVFAKGAGETSVYATDAAGKTVWSATIRVGANFDSVDRMLAMAMPEAKITATPMNGVLLLTGTVANPDDEAEAVQLAQAFVGDTVKIISRLRTATPLQVMLKVRIAEVSRSLSKSISSNLATQDSTGGFRFGIGTGRDAVTYSPNTYAAALPKVDASSVYGLPPGSVSLPFDPQTGKFVTGPSAPNVTFNRPPGTNVLSFATKLFGLDFAAAFDFAEQAGLISTLAQPNLTTVSGETAEFLAGGEIPIPVSQGLGQTSIQFRNYGVSLSYTPTVLSDGRISLRVRPEVSDLSSVGAVTFNGLQVPALVTRRAETTVELGSGQSFMIAGLLSNSASSSVSKIPGLGDIPVLGNLFKSNGWKKNETELMIVITPYLVKPVSDSQIVLPTDGFRNATDAQRLFLNQQSEGVSGEHRPMPGVVPSGPAPALGAGRVVPAPQQARSAARKPGGKAAAPGFSY